MFEPSGGWSVCGEKQMFLHKGRRECGGLCGRAMAQRTRVMPGSGVVPGWLTEEIQTGKPETLGEEGKRVFW